MDAASIVGALATICSTTSFVPQAWKVIRTRDTSAISKRMYAITVTGFSLWLAYAFLSVAVSGFMLAMSYLAPNTLPAARLSQLPPRDMPAEVEKLAQAQGIVVHKADPNDEDEMSVDEDEEKPGRPQLPPPEAGTTLFVRNVPFEATDEELRTT